MKFIPSERAAIDAAWQSIRHLCGHTDWTDGPVWREAEKLERREVGDTTAARAVICKAWFEGCSEPDRKARTFYWIRPGYLKALLLGVGHAVQRAGSDYTGQMVTEARALCPAAIAANDAHTRRIVA